VLFLTYYTESQIRIRVGSSFFLNLARRTSCNFFRPVHRGSLLHRKLVAIGRSWLVLPRRVGFRLEPRLLPSSSSLRVSSPSYSASRRRCYVFVGRSRGVLYQPPPPDPLLLAAAAGSSVGRLRQLLHPAGSPPPPFREPAAVVVSGACRRRRSTRDCACRRRLFESDPIAARSIFEPVRHGSASGLQLGSASGL
jgi:hypothetical protein